jgi:hypothetical protein
MSGAKTPNPGMPNSPTTAPASRQTYSGANGLQSGNAGMSSGSMNTAGSASEQQLLQSTLPQDVQDALGVKGG